MDYVFVMIVFICGISDYKKRIIPNIFTIPLALLCLLYQTYMGNIAFALLGLMIGCGIGWLCFVVNGMGGGDVKLMAAIGAYLGTYSFISVLFLASVISIIWGLALFLREKATITSSENIKNLKLTIPFGTCLSISLFCMYLYPYL